MLKVENPEAKNPQHPSDSTGQAAADLSNDPAVESVTKMPIDFNEFVHIALAKDPLKEDISETFTQQKQKHPKTNDT